MLSLLMDAFDAPPVVRVGATWSRSTGIHMQEGRAVIELEADDMAVAIEQLVLDSVTAAKSRAVESEAAQSTRT